MGCHANKEILDGVMRAHMTFAYGAKVESRMSYPLGMMYKLLENRTDKIAVVILCVAIFPTARVTTIDIENI